jgi:hypothetical protein
LPVARILLANPGGPNSGHCDDAGGGQRLGGVEHQPGTTFNFQVPPSARGSAAPNSFYVPYDQIPAANRVEAEQWMVTKKLIPPRFAPPAALPVTGNIPASDRERRKLIEDAYANYLAGGGNWRDGK